MNRWFGNLSVTLKLALGFGLVLLMTTLLAVASWSSLGSVIERSTRTADINRLNGLLSELRVQRLLYMQSNGDEKIAEQVQRSLDIYNQDHIATRGKFQSAENVQALSQQVELIGQYQQSLNGMRQAYRQAEAARLQMGQLARDIFTRIDVLLADALQLPEYDERRFARYSAVRDAKENLQLVRYEVRGYTANVNAKTEQAMKEQMARAITSLDSLSAAFGSDNADDQASVRSGLEAYQGAVVDFQRANDQVIRSRDELTRQGYEIVRLSDELVAIQVERGQAESSAARTLQTLVTLLALVFGVFAAWIITRQITRPLSETLAVVERIASGDLTAIKTTARRDELGLLQQGIQRMGNTLRELISGIRDSVSQIASAAEELSAVTEQTSAGVNSQKLETDQVATAMQEMSATVQEVARNAEQASQAASDADQEAHRGDEVVAEAIRQIEELAEEMTRSTQAMSLLQEESDKIGSVMDVIKAVADQTNLLALNAAIEAARAGEAGRGFAVVADEVRGLAKRTQQSTEEIESLISALQRGTQQVAGVLQESRTLTEGSVERARRAGESLAGINQKVSNIQSMNQQIAAAAEQQGAVAEEIGRSIINVRDVAEQTATASNETAKSSAELARLGNQLQSMVSRFRV